MKLRKIFSAVFLFGFILSAALTAAARDEWLEVRSKNFRLVGDASEKDIGATAAKLEQFREIFRQSFPNATLNLPLSLNMVVFKSDESLRAFGTPDKENKNVNSAAGYFQHEEGIEYLTVSIEGGKPFDYRAIFHEYVHLLLNENIGRSNVPPWLNEGLAEFFKTAQIENDQKVTLGDADGDFSFWLQPNKLIPFETFFSTDYYSLHKQRNHGVGIFYAQARALTQYLMHSDNGARTEQINKFIQLISNGKNQKYAFAEAFQTDYQTMEADFKKYLAQKSFRRVVTNLENKLPFDAELKITPISEAETKIILGDLHYQFDRLAEAAAMFEAALKLDANSSPAASSLGLVKLRQGKTGEAAKLLEKAVALDDKNYLAHYRYAYFLSREGMTDYGFASNYTGAQAAQMRESLDAAIRLNPAFPESYNLYAFVNYVRAEAVEQAAEYLARALKISPGNQRYQLRLAELSMLKEDFEKARRIARKIYETAPDERLRVYAKNTIYTIDTYQSQLESIKNPNRKRLRDVTDQPLTDEESARLNWLAMLEGINANLRRLKPNEKRVLGYLTRIECGANGIEYLIKTGNQTLKLNSETFDTLMLMSYSADASGGQVGCGTLNKETFAVIVYRPTPLSNMKSAGEIVSIEFVPKNFKFLN